MCPEATEEKCVIKMINNIALIVIKQPSTRVYFRSSIFDCYLFSSLSSLLLACHSLAAQSGCLALCVERKIAFQHFVIYAADVFFSRPFRV